MPASVRLPQSAGGLFLSDGGLETTLVFLDGVDLPCFAAYVLLADEAGRQQLRRYYEPYLALCESSPGAGFVLETPTWRANPDWAERLGHDRETLARFNRDAVALVADLREAWRPRIGGPLVLSGVIGPRGDGYVVERAMDADEAERYHRTQAQALVEAGVDMLSAVTMTSSAEAMGVARVARALGVGVAISFTVETDGRLPSGEPLRFAVEAVDGNCAPDYFGINCAHPVHFEAVIEPGAAWAHRIRALRANASTKSHAELDASTELDIGDPSSLGGRYVRLRGALPALNVLGGCCGTDVRHLQAIRDAWVARPVS